MYNVSFDQFEGPLDLLLDLIEHDKLDITKVSLAKITEDYLQQIQKVKLPPEELADFLVIASKLIFIKSQALFPQLNLEEEGVSLESQLKIFKLYHDASKQVESLIQKNQFVFFRDKMPVERIFRPPPKLGTDTLHNVFQGIVKTLTAFVRVPKEVVMKAVSIGERIEHLKNEIIQRLTISFHGFVGSAKDKTEMIVSFLALLELCKQKIVEV